MHKIFIVICTALVLNLCASEAPKKLTIYSIPGQNWRGSGSPYIDQILMNSSIEDIPEDKRLNVVPVATPRFPHIDLGQDQCIALLEKAIAENPSDNGLIYATSQGTATALNYLGHVTSHDHIKALVLEATLASGNSAIRHTMRNLPGLNKYGWVTDLPAANYWNPYFAKAIFPRYWPGGKQAIKSIEHIVNTNKPIVIIHSKDDLQLSYNDACALYYGLHKNGNKNTYFISCEGRDHLHILQGNYEFKPVLTTILAKHGILPNSRQEVDLAHYQPDPEQFRKQHEELRAKEAKHEIVKYGLVAAATLAAGKLLYRRIPQFLAKIALSKVSAAGQ